MCKAYDALPLVLMALRTIRQGEPAARSPLHPLLATWSALIKTIEVLPSYFFFENNEGI